MKPCYLCGKRTDDCLFDPPVCRECQRAHELTKERTVATSQPLLDAAERTAKNLAAARKWAVGWRAQREAEKTAKNVVVETRGYGHLCGLKCWAEDFKCGAKKTFMVAELNGGPATAKLMSLEEYERALESATFDESD